MIYYTLLETANFPLLKCNQLVSDSHKSPHQTPPLQGFLDLLVETDAIEISVVVGDTVERLLLRGRRASVLRPGDKLVYPRTRSVAINFKYHQYQFYVK